MWSSIRRKKIRYARSLSPTIHRITYSHRNYPHLNVRFLRRTPPLHRPISRNRFRSITLRLRVRVSNELGARNPKSAAFSVIGVNIYSLITCIILAIVILACRDVLSYAFTEGEKVSAAVSDLCPLLAVTLILNGIQPVLSGVAVGCGWQTFVAKVNVGCYYIIGIPLGALLGFYFNFGAKGIWTGMIGTIIQTFILGWVTFTTDWTKEVKEASKRLDVWGNKKQEVVPE